MEQAQSDLEDLSSRVDDLETTVSAICHGFAGYSGAFQDIYISAC